MTPDQQAFEDRCWEHYLAERARRTMPGDVEGEPTREGLFWRREDGQYGVLAFNTAWMAYQWGMQAGRGQGVPDAVAEVIGCFSAAEVEGLSTALAETSDERLKDLVERRLMYALYACQSLASAPPAPQAIPPELDVRTILLVIEPGADGMGEEVYAKSVADVEAKLTAMDQELEEWQLGIKRLPAPQASTVQHEPFCFASVNKNGDVTSVVKRRDSWRRTPLYTHPAQYGGTHGR